MGPALSLVMPYYDNAAMLALQYDKWAAWPERLKARLRVVLVDDGSRRRPAVEVARPDGLPDLGVWRVLEDRPWHQHAARNLGAHVAGDGWMLLTDMDHVLSVEAAAAIFKHMDKARLDVGAIYMLGRVDADTGAPPRGDNGRLKPHPNSFLVTRATYWNIGGYDEDYCGIYGTDGLFRARAANRASMATLGSVALTRYWRDLVADASTTTLPRKEGRDPGAKQRIAAAKAARGEAGTIKVLQFPWVRVV